MAKDVYAAEDLPAFDRSAVDGFAVVSRDTFGASAAQPSLLRLAGEVKMGERAGFALAEGTCAVVWTGGELPQGADAMVMIEFVEDFGGGDHGFVKAVAPGANMIFKGEDLRPGDKILEKGKKVAEYPVIMRERTEGVSSISPIKSVYYMIKVTLAILMEKLRQ